MKSESPIGNHRQVKPFKINSSKFSQKWKKAKVQAKFNNLKVIWCYPIKKAIKMIKLSCKLLCFLIIKKNI